MIEKNLKKVENIIKNFLKKQPLTIITIDGPSGSGKSTLAKSLAKITDSNLFFLDDFFLPKDKKTQERLLLPGGNIDYERFKSEVLDNLKVGNLIKYHRFDCNQESYLTLETTIKPLVIVEGVYSAHPYFNKYYDYLIYLNISYQNQLARIENRSGTKLLDRFINEWIPLENKYFDYYQINKKANLVINID